MTETIEDSLANTAVETLEQLAFLFAFTDKEVEPQRIGASVTAAITFSGEFCGTLAMTISAEVLTELAANMLGIEEGETTADQQHDALRELLNVLCGNLLPKIGGKQAIFDLKPPEIVTADNPVIHRMNPSPAHHVHLVLEEGGCDLTLFVDEPPEKAPA